MADLKFKGEQADLIVETIKSTKGDLKKALVKLDKKGLKMSYRTLQNYNFRHVKQTEIKQKEAVKLLELNGFDYIATLRQLEENLNLVITRGTLKSWFRKHAKNVCDDVKVKDVVSNLTDEVAKTHIALAEKIYDARQKIVDRIIDMIPTEKDMNKLSIAYKTLTEVLQPSELAKQPLTLISQYNAYYKDRNGKEDRNTGNIPDATIVSE